MPPSHDPARGEHGVTAKRKKKHYGRTAKVGAVWSLLRRGGQELVAIPTSAVMARLLVPEEFGVAAAASFFILLATRLTQFGFNAAIVRVKELRPEHASSVFAVNLAFGVAVYLALFGAAPYIGQFLRSPEAGALLPHAALVFLITPFGTVPSALIARRLQFRYMAVGDWTDTTVGAIASIVLATYGYGYWSLVYGQLAGTALRVMVKMYLSGWRPSVWVSAAALRELLSFGLGLQTKRLFEFATNNLDTLVVGRVLGMAPLGVYDKAFTTMNRLVNRLTLGDVYFRIFSIIHEEPLRFRRAYSRLVLSVSMLGLPAFAVAIVVARPLFLLMYGDNWLAAVVPFQLLCAGGMLKLFNAYASQANEASGNIWGQAWRQGFGTVCIVVGALVGARVGGVVGAATGVAIGMAILTYAIQALVRRTTGLTWAEMLRPQVPAVTCTLILVGILLGVGRLLTLVNPDPSAWQLLALQAAAALVVYTIFVLASPFRDLAEVVDETAHQLLPARVAEHFQRVAGIMRPAAAARR
ncbi:MAG TPA: lipopolysaccharide biosynthesis protein [Vicinamibacterales bacterium]